MILLVYNLEIVGSGEATNTLFRSSSFGDEMIKATNKIHIERPAWFVFEFLADIEHCPLWEHFGVRAIRITPGPIELGTEYRLIHSNYERILRAGDVMKDRRIAVATVEKNPGIELSIHLHPEGDQVTLVSFDWKLLSGLPGIVETLLVGKIKQVVSESVTRLRELIETGSVTLDDRQEIQISSE
jgi:hypothetical protein